MQSYNLFPFKTALSKKADEPFTWNYNYSLNSQPAPSANGETFQAEMFWDFSSNLSLNFYT